MYSIQGCPLYKSRTILLQFSTHVKSFFPTLFFNRLDGQAISLPNISMAKRFLCQISRWPSVLFFFSCFIVFGVFFWSNILIAKWVVCQISRGPVSCLPKSQGQVNSLSNILMAKWLLCQISRGQVSSLSSISIDTSVLRKIS